MKNTNLATLETAFQKKICEYCIKQKGTLVELGGKTLRTKIFRSDELERTFPQSAVEELFTEFVLAEPASLANLLDILLKNQVLMRLEREEDPSTEGRLKWPKKMRISPMQAYQQGNVHFLSFTSASKEKSWKAYLIVIGVFILFMYPIWPFFLRLIGFYLCFYFLIFLIILQIVRAGLYVGFRAFGYEFWILPNINENNMSLKPFYTFSRCSDDSIIIFIRTLGGVSLVAFTVWVLKSPRNREDIQYFVTKSHNDALTYGIEKIYFNYTSDARKHIPLEALMEDGDDPELNVGLGQTVNEH